MTLAHIVVEHRFTGGLTITLPGVLPILQAIKETIMSSDAQTAAALEALATSLGDVSTQLAKATDEIIVAISQAGSTPATDAAVAKLQALGTALKAASQTLDDLNQDAAPPAPV